MSEPKTELTEDEILNELLQQCSCKVIKGNLVFECETKQARDKVGKLLEEQDVIVKVKARVEPEPKGSEEANK